MSLFSRLLQMSLLSRAGARGSSQEASAGEADIFVAEEAEILQAPAVAAEISEPEPSEEEKALDRWHNPGLYGNEITRPLSTDEALAKYPFVSTISRQFGITDPAVLGDLTVAHADYRRRNRIAYYTEGQVAGWRFSALLQREFSATFIGVDDAGLVHARQVTRDYAYDPAEDEDDRPLFDWTYSDPLESVRQITAAFAKGEHPKGAVIGKQTKSVPFIIQSKEFRDQIDSRKNVISLDLLQVFEEHDVDDEATRRSCSKITYTALQDEKRRIGAMTNKIMASLNPEVQKTMRSLGVYSVAMANWLTGEVPNGRKADRELARNRQQAVASYPLLAKTLMDVKDLRSAIDAGAPLAPLLSEGFGVAPQTLSRLQGVTWQKADRAAFRNPKKFLEKLDRIAPDQIPTTRRGFSDFNVAYEAARILYTQASNTTIRDILAGVGGRFDKVAQLAEGNPPSGLQDMAQNIDHQLIGPAIVQSLMAKGFNTQEALETAVNAGSYYFGRHAPLTGLSVRNAMQNSARWHRNVHRIMDTLDEYDTGVDWAALTPPVELPCGLVAVPLHSGSMLKEEGLRQNHCVGGYTQDCVEGSSLIYSLRTNTGEVVSTVEYQELDPVQKDTKSPSGAPTVVRDLYEAQNYGPNNDTPSKKAQSGARELKRHLDHLPEDAWNSYEIGRQHAMAQQEDFYALPLMSQRARYDATSRESLDKAWGVLSEYLPRGDRKMGLDHWIEKRIAPSLAKYEAEMQAEDSDELEFDLDL